MNRVLSSQPQALAILRDKLEACYQAEVEVDGLDTSQLRREGAELCTALMKAKSSQQPQPDVEREEKVSLQGWSLLETQDTDSVHSSEMTDRFDPNNISVRRTQVYLLFGSIVVERACSQCSRAKYVDHTVPISTHKNEWVSKTYKVTPR